jgi:hypothetical protein
MGAVSFGFLESSFGSFNERLDFLEYARLVIPIEVIA